MSRARAAVLIVYLLALAAAAAGQVRESVTVNLVEVPVTAVDSSGNAVRGLTAANFELFDQGKKQAITSFDVIDFASRDNSPLALMNPAARRSFLLLFDLGYSSPNSLARAKDAARQFVKDSVQPRDLVAVGTIDVDRGFHLLAAFTTDRDLVAAAIGDPQNFRGTDPLQIANLRATFAYDELPEQPSLPSAPNPGEEAGQGSNKRHFQELAHDSQQDVSENMTRQASGNVRKRIEKQVDALGDLARMLGAVPGRKQIIFLSEGFDAQFLQGRGAEAGEEQRKENDNVLNGDLAKIDMDARYGSSSSLTILDRMAHYFRSSDVVLNAIDIKGVRVQNDAADGAVANSNAGLFTLARPTGGVVFQNSNDLNDNFSRMLRGQEVVYVLGYQAAPVKPGAFHELKVKVSAPNVARVSHRAGYVESRPESAVEKELTDAEIVMNDLPQSGVRVDALAAAFPGDAARAQVPVVVEMNGEDLLQSAKDGNAAAEVFVYAFDSKGVVRDRLFEKMRLDLDKAGDRLRNTGAKWLAMLTLPPGDYAVKTLVRIPDTDRRGFARVNVHVPQPGEVAATPFFVEQQPRSWVIVRGTTLDPAAYPFQVGSDSVMPRAVAHLRKGEPQRFALFVSAAEIDDMKVDAAFVRADGKPAAEAPRIVGEGQSNGMAKLLFESDMAGLEPGPAALRIVVHRSGMNDLQTTLPLVVSQ
jgi:VWFA-related protein